MTDTPVTAALAAFDDSTLIKLALEGNTEGFAVLMERHLVAVKKCIASMVQNMGDAEDLLQEVLVKAWCHLASFRAESSFRTWVSRVAMNEVLQAYRRRRSRPVCQLPMDVDNFASSCESPLASLTRAEATHRVRSAVASLPAKYRQVLIMRDLEELTARETAQRLDSTVPAIKTRLFRARLMLSAALRSRPVTAAEARRSRCLRAA